VGQDCDTIATPFLVGPRALKPVYGARTHGACLLDSDFAPFLEMECFQQVVIVSIVSVKNRQLTSIMTGIAARTNPLLLSAS
jgi:hypothetical protein